MNKAIVFLLLFSACEASPTSTPKTVKHYSGGGYGFWVNCADIKWTTSGFIGIDCDQYGYDHHYDKVLNLTNVTEIK